MSEPSSHELSDHAKACLWERNVRRTIQSQIPALSLTRKKVRSRLLKRLAENCIPSKDDLFWLSQSFETRREALEAAVDVATKEWRRRKPNINILIERWSQDLRAMVRRDAFALRRNVPPAGRKTPVRAAL